MGHFAGAASKGVRLSGWEREVEYNVMEDALQKMDGLQSALVGRVQLVLQNFGNMLARGCSTN